VVGLSVKHRKRKNRTSRKSTLKVAKLRCRKLLE